VAGSPKPKACSEFSRWRKPPGNHQWEPAPEVRWNALHAHFQRPSRPSAHTSCERNTSLAAEGRGTIPFQLEGTMLEWKTQNASHGTLRTSHRALSASNGPLSNSHGGLSASHGQLSASNGALSMSHGALRASNGALSVSHGGLRTSHGALSVSHEALSTPYGTLSTSNRRPDRRSKESETSILSQKPLATPIPVTTVRPSQIPTCECAVSSVVEHYLDTVGVTGSNPVSRTI
jgi:hypothetical protein